jgi:hypothetical protein
MYAEIRITVMDGISSSLDRQAAAWLAPTVLPAAAIAVSGIEQNTRQLDRVVVATLPPSHVMIVSRDDAATLRVYVELTAPNGNWRLLKIIAEETAGDIACFLRAHGMKVASLRIGMHAEGERLETGRRFTWVDRFLSSARKEVAGRLSVPVATFLVGLALDSGVAKAATSAAAAFVGVIVWLLVSATLEKPGYRYE